MVHKDLWPKLAEEGCVFMAEKQKCNCKGHKRLRTGIKTINFGLAYGMSKYKLAATLRITAQEAEEMIELYFSSFPKIKKVLEFLGEFGVKNGYIRTLAPYGRKRFFPLWLFAKKNIDTHLKKIHFDKILGAIERQSKNQPIQGSGADVTKTALVLIYDYIHNNNLTDKVRLVAQVHDQITTVAREEYAEEWMVKMDELMCKAAQVVVKSGILKAETAITPVWSK